MFLKWLRHRLPALTTLWLCCQVLSLSALAPRYCCAAHSHDSASAPNDDASGTHCHESAPADSCPMASATGVACPMHAGSGQAEPADVHAHHSGHSAHASSVSTGAAAVADESSADDCAMRATCQGPVTALASLIWIPGVLDDTQSSPAAPVTRLRLSPPESAASFVRPIDLPPPRV